MNNQNDHSLKLREHWGSKFGIILAVAGSAIGLGNFLRFPAKVVENGGGAFMIPYFISILLLGIPLMWVEWTLGRHGGIHGSGTAPGIFHRIAPKFRWAKYLGILGVLGPLIIFMYYLYIESWTLGYSFFALTGKYTEITDPSLLKSFLSGYQGIEYNQFFQGIQWAYVFFLITFAVNMYVIYQGISGGIEKLCNWAMPVLIICGIILLIRVLTLGSPNAAHPDWNVANGLGMIWNPDFSRLTDAKIWLEASGQVFFTLSVGIGVLLTYASYLTKKDDVVLSGATSVTANEFAEVILGGSIIIPAAFMFLGPVNMQSVVEAGTFNLGFVTMPLVLNQLPLSQFFSFIWFFFLFLAALTSSVSLSLPFVSFLEDEFGCSKKRAVVWIGITSFILCQPAIFFLKNGVVDEMDFWGGSVFLILFATVEIILFGWVFGIDKGWKEMHEGAQKRVPGIYKFIIKYVTPAYLLVILGSWAFQQWGDTILMKNVSAENFPFVLGTRLGILVLFIILSWMVHVAWKRYDNLEDKR